MIKARIADEPKILLIFDAAPSEDWLNQGKATGAGVTKLVNLFREQEILLPDISIVNLADVVGKAKSADYKAKAEYIKELIDTYAYNVLVPIGAEAFTRTVGFKGQQKYLLHTVESEVYPGRKVIPLPNPAQAAYDPSITETIHKTIAMLKTEMEFPEIHTEKLEVKYLILDDMAKVKSFFKYFMSDKVTEFAYDTETTGFMHNRDELTTIQLSHKPTYSYLIPCNTKGSWAAAPNIWSVDQWEEIKQMFRDLFAAPGKLVIGHNKKFDDKFMFEQLGVQLQKDRSFDTMLAAFLCDENTPNGLKELTCQLTDMGDYELPLEKFKDAYCKEHKVLKKQSNKNPDKPVFSYGFVPFEMLAQYALCDADATIRLYHHFKEELKKEDMELTFQRLMRISWVLTRFELNGWPIDVPYAEKLKIKLSAELETVKAALLQNSNIRIAEKLLARRKLAKDNEKRKKPLTELKEPFVFNFNSNQQKQALYFEVLKFKIISTTDSGQPSTDREAVSTWMRTNPHHKEFLQNIQYYGELTKFLGTYVAGILRKTVNGRVHGTYNAIGAKTGRTSSSDPNLQNLPARGDDRKMKLVKAIKRMFCAPEGYGMLGADLSAIEMRWAAIVSGDSKLLEIFQGDGLIHEAVAKELFDYIDCPLAEVKKKYEFERNSVSKTVQFLSVYGGGAEALARKVNDSIIERQEMAKSKGETLSLKEYTKEQAQEILDNYFKKYSGLSLYIKDVEKFVLKNGYALSPYGYKRRVPAAMLKVERDEEGYPVDNKVKLKISEALRQAVNATIQNPASVSLLLALANLQEEIDTLVEQGLLMEDDFLLLGAVHDAGYNQVRLPLMTQGRDMLLEHMTAPPLPNCPIPIGAEAEWGVNWADFSDKFDESLSVLGYDEEDTEEELEEAA